MLFIALGIRTSYNELILLYAAIEFSGSLAATILSLKDDNKNN